MGHYHQHGYLGGLFGAVQVNNLFNSGGPALAKIANRATLVPSSILH